ncbi:MAG TPA: zinc ribbon domain-containing protein [Kiritimatiellia bacterium]|nr:zinc ribbon domain-containing protein [Kiritimatiellia bacterium]HMP33147.1 zinc ribbon domain-containing protein [Kiritimatiellia bacterium]
MPTYEYACQKCGYEFEKFQSIKDEPVKRCPTCKGKVVKKFSSGAGLLFKGSGFYITDYRSEGYKSAAKSDSTTSSTPASAPAAAPATTPSSSSTSTTTSAKAASAKK